MIKQKLIKEQKLKKKKIALKDIIKVYEKLKLQQSYFIVKQTKTFIF